MRDSLGQHIYEIQNPLQIVAFLKNIYVGNILYTLSITSVKLSVLALLASIRDQGSYHNLHRYCRGNYLVYRHCKSYIPVSDHMFSDFNTDYNVP
jgi:hypothetical protein